MVTQGQMWWCHLTLHIWFPIYICSNYMPISRRLDLIDTQNFLLSLIIRPQSPNAPNDPKLTLHVFFKFGFIFMRFSTSKPLLINDHLKAHCGVQILPKDFRHRRPSVGRALNPQSRGWESSTLTTRPPPPYLERYKGNGTPYIY